MLKPKNIVVTGGSTGIGLEVIKSLYSEGNNVIYGSVDKQANLQSFSYISKLKGGTIKCFFLDLSSIESIQQFANKIKNQFEYVDVLINNAGVYMSKGLKISSFNIQMTLSVNYFGHFYLTFLLLPLIKQSEEARIISTASIVHYFSPKDILSDLKCESKRFFDLRQYSISKLMMVLFTQGLSNYFKAKGYSNVKAVSLHPGFVNTQLTTEAHQYRLYLRIFKALTCCLYVNAQAGAKTTLYLTRLKFNILSDGQYYSNCKVQKMSSKGRDIKLIQQLWRFSQSVFKIRFD